MFSSNASQVSNDAVYVEDVFSTYLVTGTGSSSSVVNGIDLSTKGGMVWSKRRDVSGNNIVVDTARGGTVGLVTNNTAANISVTTTFNVDGYSTTYGSGYQMASWTFRKQPKFFDVVTYTGNGVNGRQISHSLGSVPGCIIVKKTDSSVANWYVQHRSLTAAYYICLNTTAPAFNDTSVYWNNTEPTSTVFTVGDGDDVNQSGRTYVAYLFAHNAGGFGLTGTDNVISCGSFTTDSGGNATVNLGYEPQWLLMRQSDASGDWMLIDNMRGWNTPTGFQYVVANASSAEASWTSGKLPPSATGFSGSYPPLNGLATYIYIAIRRGPMKVPTDATKVFAPIALSGSGTNPTTITAGITPDLFLSKSRNQGSIPFFVTDRLRGGTQVLSTSNVIYNAEGTDSSWVKFDKQDSVAVEDSWLMGSGGTYINYFLKRAPAFFDEVCYTGTGANRTVSHNLGVAPELMIVKNRSSAANWAVYSSSLGAVQVVWLNNNSPKSSETTYFNSTSPTSSVFTVGTDTATNDSGSNYVAYLFATLTGVSKVGSYTGNGSSQTINCGFTGGARFVMIKRTNSTGDWYVWDTARGMVSGTDPFLRMNETYTENNTNSVYTTTTGFQVATTEVEMNASGSTYIYLAIA